ncbi:sugar phosphate isomerase/epimerase family protein [Spiribacter onubensis]|uniref:Sugar phosphate isomerase/epimerase n=1 Tax=Spiribacter onubensis TaxID=3122420 RepID=A0ABV3S703_9GAMM
MNALGIHALVWACDIEPASTELAARQTRAAGYDFLELSLHDTTQLDVEHARAVLAEQGLGVACSRGLAFDADISSDDPAIVARGQRLLGESVEVAAALGARNLCGALYSALGKYSQPVLDCGDRLGYVHIGENHRGYLGAGAIDFGSFFHALRRIDYRGEITFESFSSAVVMPGLCSDLAVWRNLWSDGMDLAISARSFMQAHLRAAATI